MNKDQIRQEILKLVEIYVQVKEKEKIDFVPGKSIIPPSGKVIGSLEIMNMVEASLDGWLTAGRFNHDFERELAEYIGVNYAITVNSGSSANLSAFAALTSPKLGKRAISKGDEVITVAAGFPTTINPILQLGAVPVFVDIDIPTYNIDVLNLEAAISKKTKAIMLAHTLGNPYNLDDISEICEKYELWLIEDCCDALGSTYKGRKVGTFGDIATLSFYPAHHITMGEGGAVLTNNPVLKQAAESFRDWGRDCYCDPGQDNTCKKRFSQKIGDLPEGYDHKYIYSHLGYNLKITDMQAACGLAQLTRINNFVKARQHNFTYLYNSLVECQEYLILPRATKGSDPSWFGFLITVKEDDYFNRKDLLQYLNQNKIGTRLLFAGNAVKQPYMKTQNYRVVGSLDRTDQVMLNTFWVGIYPDIGKNELDFLAQCIKNYFGLGF